MHHGLPSALPPNYSSPVAQQRAAQALQQKFGQGANPQISQLQANAAMLQQGRQQHQSNPQNIQLPQQMTEHQRQQYMDQIQQRQLHQARQMQQPQQRSQVSNAPVSSAQTDGLGEWDDLVTQRRAVALNDPNSTLTADLTIRQQLEESSRAMEGGGLMLPLSEQPRGLQIRKRKTNTAQGTSNSQFDGPNDSTRTPKVSNVKILGTKTMKMRSTPI